MESLAQWALVHYFQHNVLKSPPACSALEVDWLVDATPQLGRLKLNATPLPKGCLPWHALQPP